jgi:hypothetical protein
MSAPAGASPAASASPTASSSLPPPLARPGPPPLSGGPGHFRHPSAIRGRHSARPGPPPLSGVPGRFRLPSAIRGRVSLPGQARSASSLWRAGRLRHPRTSGGVILPGPARLLSLAGRATSGTLGHPGASFCQDRLASSLWRAGPRQAPSAIRGRHFARTGPPPLPGGPGHVRHPSAIRGASVCLGWPGSPSLSGGPGHVRHPSAIRGGVSLPG